MAKKNELSVIITAHSEGILLHKTLLSVFDSIDEIKNSIDTEIIIHVDDPDQKTIEYLETHQREDIAVYCNHFRDPGLSRNFAIQKAKGNIIAIIDGDDVVSKNWLQVACEMILNSDKEIIVHPEHNLTFGIDVWQQVLWTQEDSKNNDDDKLILAGSNCWISCCVAKKETFLRFPYRKTENGYGNEDWYFNCETLAAGVSHVVAKDTVQFYRRKTSDSVLNLNTSGKNVQLPNPLFDLMSFKQIQLPAEKLKTSNKKNKSYYLKRAFRITHGAMLRTPLKYGLIPAAKVVKKTIHYKQDEEGMGKRIPRSVFEEWKRVMKYESQLYPTKWRIKDIARYTTSDKYSVGKALRMIIEPMTDLPDYVFIVPWIKAGGADKVMLNYIKALSIIHPEWHFAIITTLCHGNDWKDKLPQNAYVLDFGNITKDLNCLEKESVFDRLIVELRCKRIHLINSQFGYEYIASHKELFAKNYDLAVSVFCYDYIPGSKAIFEYADPYLVEIYEETKKIFTDNASYAKRCVDRCGFSADKLAVHYQPVELEKVEEHKKEKGKKTRIFWASRVAYQKNPELLIEIAKKLDNTKYEIDVYGELNEKYKKNIFDNIPSLRYKGKFNGLRSIDAGQYDLFLYTSRIDGVPNTILEVANLEIPIVASNAGGVGEFVKNGKTGFLVEEIEDADAYINAINEFENNPQKAKDYAKNAKKLLETQHSWEAFIKTVKKDIE